MYEVEVKVAVATLDRAVELIEQAGCRLSQPVGQEDAIFARSVDDIMNPYRGVVIARIRKEPDRVTLNVKQHRGNELDAVEHETPVLDRVAAYHMLGLLGFEHVTDVRKVRRSGRLGGYNICVDRVRGLGGFVEIEELLDDEPDQATQSHLYELLRKVLSGVHIRKIDRSYDRLILEDVHR